VGLDRKHVTISTGDQAFGRALQIVLEDYDSSLVEDLAAVEFDTDILVHRLSGDPPYETLSKLAEEIPILLLGPEEHLVPSVDSGCRGFLLDSSPLEDVASGVDTIAAHGAVVPPELLGRLLRHVVERRRDANPIPGLDQLTDREQDVFQLAARGARKEEIGGRLFISPATARTHLQSVYKKLGVHSQAELIALASSTGHFHQEEAR
jgi:DNA-binding NarL/FixJ family response regulator